MATPRPLRVAIVNDYEIVVVGTAGVLAAYADRIDVVEIDSQQPVLSDVDVVLYDSFGQVQGADMDIDALTVGSPARIVVFSWNTDPELVRNSLDHGASGYVSKGVSAEELVDMLERVHAGERVVPDGIDDDSVAADTFGRWPGDEFGLTAREAEVLALICQGLSNDEITQRAFIGINTVKTYIRTLYGKIGVDSRTRAVLWGVDHGFRPDTVRYLT